MRISKTDEFRHWFESLNEKEQAQIDSRLLRIQEHEHFGDSKDLGDSLAELRWKNGRRVYFTRTVDELGQVVMLLLGGMKNAQKKNIKKARLLLHRYTAGTT